MTILLLVAGCSDSNDLDPVVGDWKPAGPQPTGLFGIYEAPR